MRITLAIVAAGIVAGFLHNLVIALIAGGIVWAIWPKPQTHRVMIEDLKTGKIDILPPGDLDAARFLKKRKDG